MDKIKTEQGEEPHLEKPLPRGLEQVSHLFLSRARPSRSILDPPQSVTAESSHAVPGEQSVAVVLRSSQFVAREQVVSLLKAQTAALEEGLRTIDAGIPCDIGSIELLALDSANHLTIIDVDDHPNDGLFLRGVAHFDWISRNIANVRRMFQGQVINFSAQPRLVLVAPEFSPLTTCAIRYIAAPQITCLKYHTMGIAGGFAIMFERGNA